MRVIRGVMSLAIVGFIIIVFSLAAFFLLDIEKIKLFGWALTFLLLSECVLFGGLIGLRFLGEKHSGVFLKAGTTSALLLYFIATLISVLCAGFFRERFNTFILMELAIIALFAIVTVSLLVFSRSIKRSNEEDAQKVGTKEPKRGGF